MIRDMGNQNRMVGQGIQSASSKKSRELNQLRDSRQKERSQQLSSVSQQILSPESVSSKIHEASYSHNSGFSYKNNL